MTFVIWFSFILSLLNFIPTILFINIYFKKIYKIKKQLKNSFHSFFYI